MKSKKKVFIMAFVAAIVVTFINLKTVNAKLVYEDELETNAVKSETIAQEATAKIKAPTQWKQKATNAGVNDVAEDNLAEPAQTVDSSPVIEAQSPSQTKVNKDESVDQSSKMTATKDNVGIAENLGASQASANNLNERSRSEFIKRYRIRQELKNEDLLSQRLEELRLRDEVKRVDALFGKDKANESGKTDALKEEKVGTVALAKTEEDFTIDQGQEKNSARLSALEKSSAVTETNKTISDEKSSKYNDNVEYKQRMSVTPRFGLSGITNSIYNIESRYSLGLGVEYDITEYFSMQGGYTYSQFVIGAGSALSNPYYFSLQQLQMHDHVIDLGARGHLLNQKSKFRPFLGAGIAYRRGFVNYDDQTISYIRNFDPRYAQDVELISFLGYIEGGVDFKLTDMLSINGVARYFNVLSSRQSNPLNPNAFYSPGSAQVPYNSDLRSQASSTLASSNFYQLLIGLSLAF